MDGLDLNIAEAPSNRAGYRLVTPRKPRWQRLKRHGRLVSFVLLVILPTALVSGYYFAVAADQYVSEAEFVVRGISTSSPGALSSLLQTAGVTKAQDDTYAVQDYITSRDALAELIKSEDLRAVFDRPEADLISRFPPLVGGQTLEHFFNYYKKHVEVLLDTNTGISTLTVKTFRPDDSHRIAAAVLGSAERLINRMNDRQRENTLKDGLKELHAAEARVQDVATRIANFRNREALLDPNKQSVPMLQSINALQTMLSRVDLQIAQLVATSPRSPMIADNQRLATAIRAQIDEAKRKVTGDNDSLVPKISDFDMLSLQRDLADKQLSSAILSLEAARLQADRQQVYLDEVVKPNVADYAEYPKRFGSVAVFFACFLGVYIMGGLLISSAREHVIV